MLIINVEDDEHPGFLDSDGFTAWRIGLTFSLFYLESRFCGSFFGVVSKGVGINPSLRNALRFAAINSILTSRRGARELSFPAVIACIVMR